jgi:hypothetical protein
MCLVGLVIFAYGMLGFVLGIVHTAAPNLQRQGDPIFRIASAVINVAEPVYKENQQNNGNPTDPTVEHAFSQARSELTHQARSAGINELIRGLVLALIGFGIFWFHWKRAEERPPLAPQQPVAPTGPPVQTI